MFVEVIARTLSPRPAASKSGYRTPSVARLWDYLGLWHQRKDLANLDAHLLKDIGISPEAAKTEASRPIWDVPTHWQK
ncbi:MAG: DUF1127 domain-containing protein [Pseudomonadota bacterium]